MDHVSCPGCRLRFGAGPAAYLVACPECGEPLQTGCRPGDLLGYRLHTPGDGLPVALSQAIAAVALRLPDDTRGAHV